MREIRTLRCDVEGTGNVAWSRYCDTRRRKSELTVNTNFDLNRRASPRPYLREAGGAIPSAYSPNLRKTAPHRRFMPKLPIRHPHASGWSSLTTPWGFPCFVRFPCVHAAATTPAQRLNVSLRSFHPDVSVFPDRVVGPTLRANDHETSESEEFSLGA